MSITSSPDGGVIGRALRSGLAAVVTVVAAAAGLVFMVFAVLIGLAAGSALLMWALIRGRRPQGIRFGMPPGAGRFARPTSWHTAPRGEVVDIEAREVVPRESKAP